MINLDAMAPTDIPPNPPRPGIPDPTDPNLPLPGTPAPDIVDPGFPAPAGPREPQLPNDPIAPPGGQPGWQM